MKVPISNKVADAQVNAAEKIAKQKEKEREAAGNLADKEQAFKDTQARDAYVKEVVQKLADTDKQIDGLKQKRLECPRRRQGRDQSPSRYDEDPTRHGPESP